MLATVRLGALLSLFLERMDIPEYFLSPDMV